MKGRLAPSFGRVLALIAGFAIGCAGGDGPSGPPGASGPSGPSGPTGPQGVVSALGAFTGNTVAQCPAAGWAFAGATADVTVAAGQKILVTGSAGIFTQATPSAYKFGICYQPAGGTIALWGTYYGSFTPPANTYVPMSIGVLMTLPAGTHTVGPCACTSVAPVGILGDVSFVSAAVLN